MIIVFGTISEQPKRLAGNRTHKSRSLLSIHLQRPGEKDISHGYSMLSELHTSLVCISARDICILRLAIPVFRFRSTFIAQSQLGRGRCFSD